MIISSRHVRKRSELNFFQALFDNITVACRDSPSPGGPLPVRVMVLVSSKFVLRWLKCQAGLDSILASSRFFSPHPQTVSCADATSLRSRAAANQAKPVCLSVITAVSVVELVPGVVDPSSSFPLAVAPCGFPHSDAHIVVMPMLMYLAVLLLLFRSSSPVATALIQLLVLCCCTPVLLSCWC